MEIDIFKLKKGDAVYFKYYNICATLKSEVLRVNKKTVTIQIPPNKNRWKNKINKDGIIKGVNGYYDLHLIEVEEFNRINKVMAIHSKWTSEFGGFHSGLPSHKKEKILAIIGGI